MLLLTPDSCFNHSRNLEPSAKNPQATPIFCGSDACKPTPSTDPLDNVELWLARSTASWYLAIMSRLREMSNSLQTSAYIRVNPEDWVAPGCNKNVHARENTSMEFSGFNTAVGGAKPRKSKLLRHNGHDTDCVLPMASHVETNSGVCCAKMSSGKRMVSNLRKKPIIKFSGTRCCSICEKEHNTNLKKMAAKNRDPWKINRHPPTTQHLNFNLPTRSCILELRTFSTLIKQCCVSSNCKT